MNGKKPNTSFQARIDYSSGVPFSTKFSKYKVDILYSGNNRNGSIIEKEVAEKKLAKDLSYSPVVGQWDEEKKDFKAHGDLSIVFDENGDIQFEKTGVHMYGVVPESPEIFWETKPDENGVEHEYLCTYAYLYQRFKELETLKDGLNKQSMELNKKTLVGDYIKVDDKEYFNITDGEIIGFCILGKDIEPCFENAGFEPLFELNEDFSKALKTIKEELSKDMAAFEMGIAPEGVPAPVEVPAEDPIVVPAELIVEPVLTELEVLAAEVERLKAELTEQQRIAAEQQEKDMYDALLIEKESLLAEREILLGEKDVLSQEKVVLQEKIDTFAEKIELLNGLSDDMPKENYQAFLFSINDTSIEQLKLQAQECVIKYMKNTKAKPTKVNADFCMVIKDSAGNSKSEFPEGSWQAAVAKNALKKQNGGK